MSMASDTRSLATCDSSSCISDWKAEASCDMRAATSAALRDWNSSSACEPSL